MTREFREKDNITGDKGSDKSQERENVVLGEHLCTFNAFSTVDVSGTDIIPCLLFRSTPASVV